MTMKFTRQGVRDLNDLGGKRINGKARGCRHYSEDVVVVGRKWYTDDRGDFWVNVLGCSACGDNLGPEVEIEPRLMSS